MLKLNAMGISHLLIPLIAVVVGVAAFGTYKLVASDAARQVKPDVQPGIAQPVVDEDGSSGASSSSLRKAQRASKRDHIVGHARSQLGSSNHAKYKGPAGAWCAAFATWVWRQSGVKIPLYTYTGDIEQWGKKRGKWHSANTRYMPKPGDIAVYGTDHVGIVVARKGNQVKMIDGNWSGRVSFHTSGSNYSGGYWGPSRDFYAGNQRVTGFVSP